MTDNTRLRRGNGITDEDAAVDYAQREGVGVADCGDDVRDTVRTR
jgi:hypothetical protein